MVSLSDIAREVKMDVSVVSRALNPNPDRHAVVKKETREMIREVARKMGYVPNRTASFNGKKSSATIFCFLPRNADRLTADLMFGIVHAAGRENFPLNFFRGENSGDFAEFINSINHREHSGLITFPPPALGSEMRQLLKAYHEKRKTILMLNVLSNTLKDGLAPEFMDIPQLGIDEYYGGQLAAKHLILQGCQKFYYTYLAAYPMQHRIKGFSDAVKSAGFPEPESLLSPEDFAGLNDLPDVMCGIYADRDIQALNAVTLMARCGITPGEKNILLVGNDDKQQSAYSIPTISTIHQPSCEEGELAVKKLIRMIYGQSEENELLKPYLIVRQSSGNYGEEYKIY